MQPTRLVTFLAIVFGIQAFPLVAHACEEYSALPDPETKEYRDKLLDTAADPLDRLFAFQKLVCASNPVIRTYAVREGLKAVSDPLVREQIMFDAMFEKTRIDIELSPGSDASKQDKEFSKRVSSLISYIIAFKSPKEGCLSLYSPNECDKNYSIYLKGDKLELTYTGTVGEFRLSDANNLVGFILPRGPYGRIPAVIELF
ncbi:hypothetical protein ASD99_31320 [Mesorhizobium sp. Root695]|jgi:hypothetical protein|uniref:hypothetical protein n=1 Tax=unclassified Mesorhizobium TaxID=325217 RepID=UPI0006F93946|nr:MULTISPECIES: hypothetical protein [unclassified Mesorhizobium]KQU84946.1 hypothetical protein ASD12_31875 [Mesorhizobium sp. Root102]KRB18186.1 hypothetical protein ASD99_31320 [Mesorhizobium sp. Root695]